MPKIRVATGFELFYRESGGGEPILWIMGLGNDHRGWAYQAPAFRERFRCITYDNRDVGQSQLTDGPYSVADLAEDAIGLLDALGVEQAHVVGFSMGGAQAQELAVLKAQTAMQYRTARAAALEASGTIPVPAPDSGRDRPAKLFLIEIR